MRERHGTEICVIRELDNGALDLQHLQELLRSRRPDACNVVSVSHVPTSSGRVYDAQALGAALRGSPGAAPRLRQACVFRRRSSQLASCSTHVRAWMRRG